ncbi:MAG: thioredoxin-disulfide reductase [Longimicrobiales bacterium]|jgi:thioredoxin reductase (NADPH)|nr:thioredoxin-disulfide reductase [Gemmatimonadota bacterium]MDE0730347.1 thioredoxin-disulfide reductase [Longimicrobiales bacterium]HCK34637.1 thioredoxin-disulfide reductase [Gemmatimonadota bacterium]|tara:strand:+ start:4831 stop:5826 length:996 start_codon:yes stop_codon:yes gene_type:complete
MSDQEIRERETVVIIGSGPAAWTAAIYAARAQMKPFVFEGAGSRTMIPGGQLMFTTDVENYPGFRAGVMGPDLMVEMREQALSFGTRSVWEDIVDIDPSQYPFRLRSNTDTEVLADSVILATGANAKWLGLENEERLAQSGGGVSACAVCDGALPHFRGNTLAVIGGGDSAMEDALYLTKFAEQVIIIHRRDEFRASRIMSDRALAHDKIRVEWNKLVTEVIGNETITALRLEDTVSNEVSELEVGGMFVAIGHTPNTEFLNGVVELKENGYVQTPTAWRTETSVPGIFAAGDVMDDYFRQAVTAAGTGCMAALEAERWLAHGGTRGHEEP